MILHTFINFQGFPGEAPGHPGSVPRGSLGGPGGGPDRPQRVSGRSQEGLQEVRGSPDRAQSVPGRIQEPKGRLWEVPGRPRGVPGVSVSFARSVQEVPGRAWKSSGSP